MDINKIKNLIRIGTISAVNGAACSARVVFDDKDDLVSAELPIITIGSSQMRAGLLARREFSVDSGVPALFVTLLAREIASPFSTVPQEQAPARPESPHP